MSQISAFNPAGAALQSNAPNRFSSLSSEDFLRIMFTELSHQDPFSPNDSAAVLEQLSSIRSIESDIKLQEQLKSLVFENQLSSASGMIGKFVAGLTAENNRVAGFVISVVRQGDSVYLELDNGWILPADGIEGVYDPDALPPTGSTTKPPGGNGTTTP